MSELTSPGKVTSASGSTSLPNAGMQVKTYETRNIYQPSTVAEQKPKAAEDTAKLPMRNAQGDTFSTANPSVKPATPENPVSTRLTVMQESLRAEQQAVVNVITNAGVNARGVLDNFMSRFVNITDKIAAIFGEREKDIRDKLSDTFKNFEQKLYNFLGRVDTSMEQKDHGHQKQTRDEERRDSDEDSE